MKGKVNCTCGWSWNKSDSSKKDMYICHECGRDNSNNMKNGGWLDNYSNSQAFAPEGMVGDGFSNVGRNYSPAWGGQFQEGGKIPIAQNGYHTGDKVKYGTPEYTEAYNKGEVVTDKGVRSPITLDEVVIQNNYKRPRGFWEQSRDKYLKDNRDAGLLGAIGSVVTYPLAVGQHALTYGTTGKVQDPSEAWGHNTNEGWFDSLGAFGRNLDDTALNIFADPANLIGAGVLTKENALSKLGKIKNIPTSIAPELRRGLINSSDDASKFIKIPNIREKSINYNKNLKDLEGLSEWNKTYGYTLPNIEEAAVSDKLTDKVFKGIAQRNNTFVRGVNTGNINNSVFDAKSYLLKNNVDINNPKEVAKYMSEHIPPSTGAGRVDFPVDLQKTNKEALYSSNSNILAEGYTRGDGYIAKIRKPISFEGDNRMDWVTNNMPNYSELGKPITMPVSDYGYSAITMQSNKTKKDVLDFMKIRRQDYADKLQNDKYVDSDFMTEAISKIDNDISIIENLPEDYITKRRVNENTKIIKTESNDLAGEDLYRSTLIPENILALNKDPNERLRLSIDLDKYLKPTIEKNSREQIKLSQEYSKAYDQGNYELADRLSKEYSIIKKDHNKIRQERELQFLDENMPNWRDVKPDRFAHYIHVGEPGEKVFNTVNLKKITPESYKNTSRGHNSQYTKGLSKIKDGGIIKDDRGQWEHPGEITEIGSNEITMQGVPYPVLGISDTGDVQMMYPEEEYEFDGEKVIEFPMAQNGRATRQDSLDVYNNSKKVENFYKINNYKKDREEFSNWKKEDPHSINDEVYKDYFNNKGKKLKSGVFESDKVLKSDYRKNIDKNKYLQREQSNFWLNTDAPMQSFDRRIRPLEGKKYFRGDDAVEIPTYNNIGNKPFDLLTEKEKAQRVKQYGTKGVPNSYLNKNKKPKQQVIVQDNKTKQKNLIPDKTKSYSGVKNLISKKDGKVLETDYINYIREPIESIENNLRPIGIQSNLEPTPGEVLNRNMTASPKYYDIEDFTHGSTNYNGVQSNYRTSDLSTLSQQTPNNTRKITPRYQMGGSVYPVNYVPEAQNGKLTFLQPTSEKLPEGYRIPYADPSSELAMSIGGENGEPAYLIPSFKYGKPLYDPIGEFRKTKEHLGGPFKTYQEADEWERTVRHPAVERKETIMFPQEKFAMGGSMPGAVGFTYARTKGIPSEGPYAKKTMASAQDGNVIKDDMGQWKYPGQITEIGSNQITMQGVPYPVLGVSDTGDVKMMKPGQNYKFKGKKVTEFPLAKNGRRQEQKGLQNLEDLTNFTNYNKPSNWLNKYN